MANRQAAQGSAAGAAPVRPPVPELGGSVGGPGALLVLLGAVLVLLSYLTLNWYGVTGTTDTAPKATFNNLHHSVDQFGGAAAAAVYFDWLSWTLLIAAIVVGTLASLTTRITDAMRVLGFLIGVAGIGCTYYALLQYFDAQADAGALEHNPLYNATWGLFAVMLGFLLTAVGSVMGPRRLVALSGGTAGPAHRPV
jgi:hypothetical protein